MLSAVQTNSVQCNKPVYFMGGWKKLSSESNVILRKLDDAMQSGKIQTKIDNNSWVEGIINNVKVVKKNISERLCFYFEQNPKANKPVNNWTFAIGDNINAPFETIPEAGVKTLNVDELLTEVIAPALDKLA